MDSQSPLLFLDYDVTQYIYETYFPSKEAKENKKRMIKEFLTIKDQYLLKYKVNNIHEYENALDLSLPPLSVLILKYDNNKSQANF